MITLKQSINIMNSIKENNPEIEIYVESYPTPHFVFQEKVVKFNEKEVSQW